MFRKFIHRILNLETNERKNISLWMMFGGAIIFTIMAFIGLYLVSAVASLVFWLAVVAHAQIFSIMAGFIAQLVKRRVSVGKDGMTLSDFDTIIEEKVTNKINDRLEVEEPVAEDGSK